MFIISCQSKTGPEEYNINLCVPFIYEDNFSISAQNAYGYENMSKIFFEMAVITDCPKVFRCSKTLHITARFISVMGHLTSQ